MMVPHVVRGAEFAWKGSRHGSGRRLGDTGQSEESGAAVLG